MNTYGIPTYKEVNPSVFACVTFPFLFGIMFGDIGHGAFLFLIGAFLTLFAGPLRAKAPGLEPLLSLRYILLLMGFFAFYCGVIYNDFMAIPLWTFESCYELKYYALEEGAPHTDSVHHERMEAVPKEDCTYPIGVDPAWYMGRNELAFLNSLKMKISVILGVM